MSNQMLNFVEKNKKVIAYNVFNWVCSFGMIACTHALWPHKSNLIEQPYSALKGWKFWDVIFRQKIKVLADQRGELD